MSAGYSGTPLLRKLGIREGFRVGLESPPNDFPETLGPLPEGAELGPARGRRELDVLLLFARGPRDLARRLPRLKVAMGPSTALWLCWPKKTSPLATPELSESDVRAAGLEAGLVDIKICAVDEDWSGLKFVYRLADRPAARRSKKK